MTPWEKGHYINYKYEKPHAECLGAVQKFSN